jgi:hypothetical protein
VEHRWIGKPQSQFMSSWCHKEWKVYRRYHRAQDALNAVHQLNQTNRRDWEFRIPPE